MRYLMEARSFNFISANVKSEVLDVMDTMYSYIAYYVSNGFL